MDTAHCGGLLEQTVGGRAVAAERCGRERGHQQQPDTGAADRLRSDSQLDRRSSGTAQEARDPTLARGEQQPEQIERRK